MPASLVEEVPGIDLVIDNPVGSNEPGNSCQSELDTQNLDHSFVHVDLELGELVLRARTVFHHFGVVATKDAHTPDKGRILKTGPPQHQVIHVEWDIIIFILEILASAFELVDGIIRSFTGDKGSGTLVYL